MRVTEHSREWIVEEIENVDLEIQMYRDTYHVTTAKELEAAIRQRTVEEHPAWEDLIGWENMLDYRRKLVAELAALDAREGRGRSESGPQGHEEAGTPE